MTISCVNVIPELLYYTNQYVVNSVTNKYEIPFPDTFSILFLGDNKSFIRLLFDDTWPHNYNSYRYLYRHEDCENSASESLKRRMRLYPANSKLLVCDSDSTSICDINVFGIVNDDITMLDKLLQYRIDTTSCDITNIVYDNLTTNLSKLIYIYLNFKINSDYTRFDIEQPISDSNSVLEGFYESFIIETIFIFLSAKGT